MSEKKKLSDLIAADLPYLRRYARALTGAQQSGDRYARATLEAIIADPAALRLADMQPRTALYHAFHKIWVSTGRPIAEDEPDPLRVRAHQNMAALKADAREALLLHTVEHFSLADVAAIVGCTVDAAEALVDEARAEMQRAIKGVVLIIEDEAIIGADLASIVETMGHKVAGIAQTAAEAVELGAQTRPNLVLADIQLADDSSGIDAVDQLLATAPETPVVFITAYPERLLTGKKSEPAFLIAKPYRPQEVMTAIGQAMFFASTATLKMRAHS